MLQRCIRCKSGVQCSLHMHTLISYSPCTNHTTGTCFAVYAVLKSCVVRSQVVPEMVHVPI